MVGGPANPKLDALIAAIHREESPGIIAELMAHLKRLQADSRVRTSELIQQGIMRQCAAQPEQAKPTAIALTDADIDAHLSAVLRASGSSLRNYSNALMLSNMRAAMIAAMSHLTAPHGESDKTVGDA